MKIEKTKQLNRYADFEPTPFYFYNDKFDEKEIITQLDCMKENGISCGTDCAPVFKERAEGIIGNGKLQMTN